MKDLIIAVIFAVCLVVAFTCLFRELSTVQTSVHSILTNK